MKTQTRDGRDITITATSVDFEMQSVEVLVARYDDGLGETAAPEVLAQLSEDLGHVLFENALFVESEREAYES